MSTLKLQTENLDLTLRDPEEARAAVEAMDPSLRAELSSDWPELLRAAREPDPWVHGFTVVHRESRAPVGQCGFKAPPQNGIVEIAYAIDDQHQGKGFATEVACRLTSFALTSQDVRAVRAHTLPTSEASRRSF